MIMETKVFNLIILDESGSMCRIEKQAVDGVNETIQSIRAAQKTNAKQKHYVTLVTFNEESKVLYNCAPVDEVRDITDKEYEPNCCTALFDAMGMSLMELKKTVADENRVLVTIITDGEENSSKEYDGTAIKKLVENFKQKGWIFTYIGANQDVEKVAESMSINNTMAFEATSEDTSRVFACERACRMNLYARICDEDFDAAEENKNFFKK